MLRNIVSVGGLTMVSRVLGFVRDILTAALLGAGPVADAFFVAFRLPNHFRALFAEGAFNAAFVPVFTEILTKDGREPARTFAEEVQAILLSTQVVLLVVFLAIMPWFMLVFAPGFVDEPQKFELAVLFTRITFPYLLFISLVSLQGAMLNSMGRFAAAAAAPILLNLSLIGALVGLTPFLPTTGHAQSWGVFIAGMAQFAYLAWDVHRAGMDLRPRWPRVTANVRRFFKVLWPAAIGSGLVQINLFVDTLIASMLPTGAVSYLYYADRINQLPLGVIGVAVGTVLLPELSRRLKLGDFEAARDSQNRAIEFSLFLTLPAAVAFLTAAEPIMRVLFAHGVFTTADAMASAQTLMAYALGLPAFVLVKSLVPGFHARQDTATPVRVAVLAVSVNIGLKLVLMGPLSQVGLALATSASGWVNVLALAFLLRRRGYYTADPRLKRRLPRLVLATTGMAMALVLGKQALAIPLAQPGLLISGAALSALVAIGMVSFAILALAFGAISRADLGRFRRRRRGTEKNAA
ncbi:MAG TPA: murein biosynthesis integral membrane protein MurJ [Azospirillaceae bacterium]|nr:murein biosynthesis integral membrane protein MurJ [Azospirillaceae bacterium]